MVAQNVRAIAFYLPQYHPIPENDEWWGKGFTEWTNVTKTHPLFPGHYQPHLPADLGFYDLRLPEAREAQAKLAQKHGIHGFCYYHYWFNGRRILERPFNEVLTSGEPKFPFCLCWANENWTRTWDGGDKHILLEQKYNHEYDLAHIQSLIPAFLDERYIRINGKPLFLVYKTELLPNPARTAEIWRTMAMKSGVGDIYLVRVERSKNRHLDPRSIGFDASVEFSPFAGSFGQRKFYGKIENLLTTVGLLSKGFVENEIYDYENIAQSMINKLEPEWVWFRCVSPSWDNSARRKNALILHGSTPEKYRTWLHKSIEKTLKIREGEERIVFINAWNEWAEGNHLEPDLKFGRGYLEATRDAIQGINNEANVPSDLIKRVNNDANQDAKLKRVYWKTLYFLKKRIQILRDLKA